MAYLPKFSIHEISSLLSLSDEIIDDTYRYLVVVDDAYNKNFVYLNSMSDSLRSFITEMKKNLMIRDMIEFSLSREGGISISGEYIEYAELKKAYS